MFDRGKANQRVVLGAAALAFAIGWSVGHGAARSPREEPEQPGAGTDAAAGAAKDGVERFMVPVSTSQPSKGPADAIVTIVQWCELHGAPCRQTQAVLEQMLARYSGQVRVVFRHFAQPSREAQLGHEFARIAHEQADKFWQAQALLLAADRPPTRDEVARHAAQLGLNWETASAALDQHKNVSHLTADRLFAEMFSVEAPPALFVNGRRLLGEPSAPALTRLIDEEIADARELIARGVPKDHIYAELTKHGSWKRITTRKN